MVHIFRHGEVRPDKRSPEYRELRRIAAQHIQKGRGVSEFVAAMGRHDEPVFEAFIDENGGRL
ncbi:MAG: hypothetical protein LBC59_09570 [Chitinispirillales bacterium]|jgi:hypothetical protein|nr:hypothetical protein [Chitinispirillales bacterium]